MDEKIITEKLLMLTKGGAEELQKQISGNKWGNKLLN